MRKNEKGGGGGGGGEEEKKNLFSHRWSVKSEVLNDAFNAYLTLNNF